MSRLPCRRIRKRFCESWSENATDVSVQGISHYARSPTGKGCQKAATAMYEEQAGDQSQAVMSVLMGLQKQMAEMQVQFQQMRAEKDNVEESEQGSEVEEREATQEETDEGATAATPNSVRNDIRLIAKAAERLNRLSVDELEEEEGQDINSSRTRGKKSGSVMLASDIVKNRSIGPIYM